MSGSTTDCSATAATAASTALPPARRISTAASVASGWDVAAMPLSEIATERPGLKKSRCVISNDPASFDAHGCHPAFGPSNKLYVGGAEPRQQHRPGRQADAKVCQPEKLVRCMVILVGRREGKED